MELPAARVCRCRVKWNYTLAKGSEIGNHAWQLSMHTLSIFSDKPSEIISNYLRFLSVEEQRGKGLEWGESHSRQHVCA